MTALEPRQVEPHDWARAARDYARYRPGPPESFYARLAALGVGRPGQRILDLGTGTGVMARQFARAGAAVCGVDIAGPTLAMARELAAHDGVTVDFREAPAESTPFADGAFDVLTANQCWLYFDRARALAEARRLLRPGGALVTSHFNWLPHRDPVVAASEALILRHNPAWSAAGHTGRVQAEPPWVQGRMAVRAMFAYDEPIPFTYETWRGRIRASRGVGAALDEGAVARFDTEHDALLRTLVSEPFTVLHRLDAHLLVFAEDEAAPTVLDEGGDAPP